MGLSDVLLNNDIYEPWEGGFCPRCLKKNALRKIEIESEDLECVFCEYQMLIEPLSENKEDLNN